MTITQTFNLGGYPDGAVDVPAAPPAAPAASNTLLVNPRYAGAFGVALQLPTNVQRLQFIGFAARDYVAGETFEHRWEVTIGAVDVVFAEVGLCKQLSPFSVVDPVTFNVIAARDVAVDITTPGSYTAILEVSPIPSPQSIARGDPLWIVWSVTTSTLAPTFRSTLADAMAPLCAGAALVAWIPSNEIGAPASTFGPQDTVTPIRGLTVPPLP